MKDNRIDWAIISYINQWLALKYKSLCILLYFDLNDESRNCVSTTCAVFNCTAYLFFFWLIELINTLSKQQVTPTLVQRQYDLKTLSEGPSVTIHAYNQIWKRQVLLSPFYVCTTQASDYVDSQCRQLPCKVLVKQALSLTHFIHALLRYPPLRQHKDSFSSDVRGKNLKIGL